MKLINLEDILKSKNLSHNFKKDQSKIKKNCKLVDFVFEAENL